MKFSKNFFFDEKKTQHILKYMYEKKNANRIFQNFCLTFTLKVSEMFINIYKSN